MKSHFSSGDVQKAGKNRTEVYLGATKEASFQLKWTDVAKMEAENNYVTNFLGHLWDFFLGKIKW